MQATTQPGPYNLLIYIDNPTITLQATQPGPPAQTTSFVYHWLDACNNLQNTGNTPPRVASPPANQTISLGQGYSLDLTTVFTDTETPASLVFSASGLPSGISLTGANLSGVPSQTGVSQITLTATDPGTLSASVGFTLTVTPAPVGNTPPRVVNPVPDQTITQGQAFSLNLAGVFTDSETPNSLTLSASGSTRWLEPVGHDDQRYTFPDGHGSDYADGHRPGGPAGQHPLLDQVIPPLSVRDRSPSRP